MINALAWFCAEHHGVFASGKPSWQRPSLTATADMLALIDRPVKYFGRMTADCRLGLCAASLALRAASLIPSGKREIGLISTGFDGCLEADQKYFTDYVTSGRTLGRGNLFIYTLPTSASGEVAIALELTGPCLFIEHDSASQASLVNHATHLVADGEADAMLALWSDSEAAVCMVIDASEADDLLIAPHLDSQASPLQLARHFHSMVRQT